jgi:hypothetical protein
MRLSPVQNDLSIVNFFFNYFFLIIDLAWDQAAQNSGVLKMKMYKKSSC